MSQTYTDFNKRKDSIKIELENGQQYRIVFFVFFFFIEGWTQLTVTEETDKDRVDI